MTRYGNTVTDQYGRPIVGADIYVYNYEDESLATLEEDLGGPLANPIVSDNFGNFYFNAEDGLYILEYIVGGRKVRRDESVLVGSSEIFKGEPGKDAPQPWRQDYVATAGQTTFVTPVEYDPATVNVSLNGNLLPQSDVTAPGGTTVTIPPCVHNAEITIQAFALGGTTPGDGGGGEGPGFPEGWASVKDYGALGDGIANDSEAFQDLMADDDFPVKYIPPGTYRVNQGIIAGVDGVTIKGAGRGVTIIKWIALGPSENQVAPPAVIETAIGVDDITIRDLSIDCSKSGLGRGANNRIHGIVLKTGVRSHIECVDVYDPTGYAIWHNGISDVTNIEVSGKVIDCYVENANVGFEQIYCKNITLFGCTYRSGDGDIGCEAIFHQYGSFSNIEAVNCDFQAVAGSGINTYAEFATNPIGTVRFINSTLIVNAMSLAVVTGGTDPLGGLEISGSHVESTGYSAVSISAPGATYRFTGTTFHGKGVGVGVGNGCLAKMVNCDCRGTSTVGGDSAFGAYADVSGAIIALGGTFWGENTVNPSNAQPFAGNVRAMNSELIPDTGANQTNIDGNLAASNGVRVQGAAYLGGIDEDEVPMLELEYGLGYANITSLERGANTLRGLRITGKPIIIRTGAMNSETIVIEIDANGIIRMPNLPTSVSNLPPAAIYLAGSALHRMP